MREYKIKPNQNYVADKPVSVRVYKLGEEPKDTSYWLSRPPSERIAMIERCAVSSTVKNTIFNDLQKRFLRSLSVNSVRYLVVGGYAVGYHGHPRLTRDLDIWVGTDSGNAQAILNALNDYGIP